MNPPPVPAAVVHRSPIAKALDPVPQTSVGGGQAVGAVLDDIAVAETGGDQGGHGRDDQREDDRADQHHRQDRTVVSTVSGGDPVCHPSSHLTSPSVSQCPTIRRWRSES